MRPDATTSVDPNWDPSGLWDDGLMALLPEIDVFLPNEMEALSLARISSLDDAVARLRSAGAGTVVVKAAARGVIGAQASETVEVPAFPLRVVDSTGAGDSFDAGFLAAYLNGEPLRRCMEIGTRAAACRRRRSAVPRRSRRWTRRSMRSIEVRCRDRLPSCQSLDRQVVRGGAAGAGRHPSPVWVRPDRRRQRSERGARRQGPGRRRARDGGAARSCGAVAAGHAVGRRGRGRLRVDARREPLVALRGGSRDRWTHGVLRARVGDPGLGVGRAGRARRRDVPGRLVAHDLRIAPARRRRQRVPRTWSARRGTPASASRWMRTANACGSRSTRSPTWSR